MRDFCKMNGAGGDISTGGRNLTALDAEISHCVRNDKGGAPFISERSFLSSLFCKRLSREGMNIAVVGFLANLGERREAGLREGEGIDYRLSIALAPNTAKAQQTSEKEEGCGWFRSGRCVPNGDGVGKRGGCVQKLGAKFEIKYPCRGLVGEQL